MEPLLELIARLPIVEILKIGLLGLIFLLLLVGAILLGIELKKEKPRRNALRVIVFSLGISLASVVVTGQFGFIGTTRLVQQKKIDVSGTIESKSASVVVAIVPVEQYRPVLPDGTYYVKVPAGQEPYIVIAIHEPYRGIEPSRGMVAIKDNRGRFDWKFTGGAP